jgi:hypothetical protein
MKAATRAGVTFVGQQSRQPGDSSSQGETEDFTIHSTPLPRREDTVWRSAARQRAADRAKTWLDELEYWAAQGLPVPEDLLNSARAQMGK